MQEDTYYITPNEAALACVATSMKKARLKLDTLIINSIVGGVLFSAGGMLALFVQAEGPGLMETNPLAVKFLQGVVFPIGLFYVIILGAELFNSNVMYHTVGVCRGAVSIFDMIISLSVSWLFNLGANLLVCYVVCKVGATTTSEEYVNASIAIAVEKCNFSFAQTMIKGIAGNFCVCLAIYLQLLAKPIHVKFLMTALPIFTFVCCGFTNVIADMYLIPMGLFNGAPVTVGRYIWRTLISGTLGNFLGGVIFAVVIPFYLHLVTVERDRKLLNLPQFEVRDEQPDLEMDSRVVRVPTARIDAEINSSDEDTNSSSTYNDDNSSSEKMEPVSYMPRANSPVSRVKTNSSVLSRTMRSPPGVFPVLGMGKPLARERTIANANDIGADDDQEIADNESVASGFQSRYAEEEQEFKSQGGYNVRENKLGESLKRVLSRKPAQSEQQPDLESGLHSSSSQPQPHSRNQTPYNVLHKTQTTTVADPSHSHTPEHFAQRRLSSGTKLFKTLTTNLHKKQPTNANEIYDQLSKFNITTRAVNASDQIAGLANHQENGHILRRPDLRTLRGNSFNSALDSRRTSFSTDGISNSRRGSKSASRRGSSRRDEADKTEVTRVLSQIDSAQNSEEDQQHNNIDGLVVLDDNVEDEEDEEDDFEEDSYRPQDMADNDDLPSIISSISALSEDNPADSGHNS
ncbi:hypothetical protein WICPIJ_008917 [Wickerhamomyces pijperi]|uniref:Formate/nitrite transporter n=1 Tax=Wickerhamomyces pijperi TaxID=599730 RepID=A0A9P8PTP5_WICPI|nr:hypothetical protein WICPIJ_008917 [Wickerhamomyces pijperi]